MYLNRPSFRVSQARAFGGAASMAVVRCPTPWGVFPASSCIDAGAAVEFKTNPKRVQSGNLKRRLVVRVSAVQACACSPGEQVIRVEKFEEMYAADKSRRFPG